MDAQFMLFSLIFIRMSGFVLLNPVLGRRNIPMVIKAGIIICLSMIVWTASPVKDIEIYSTLEFGILLFKEFLLGYLLGFVMELFFLVIVYAGAVIDFQMGLSMSTIYDAQHGTQIALTGTILNVYYMLLFFAVDGHVALMKILLESGKIIPYGAFVISATSGQAVLSIFIECILLAVKLAFPIIAIEFLVEMGVGILMKMIPQINIFVVNIQLKIIVGFIVLLILIIPIENTLGTIITKMLNEMIGILKTVIV